MHTDSLRNASPPHARMCIVQAPYMYASTHTHTSSASHTPQHARMYMYMYTVQAPHTHIHIPKISMLHFSIFPLQYWKAGGRGYTHVHTHTHTFPVFQCYIFFLAILKSGGTCMHTHTHTHTHLRNTTSKNSAQKRWCSSLTQFLEANIHKPLAPSKIMYVLYP